MRIDWLDQQQQSTRQQLCWMTNHCSSKDGAGTQRGKEWTLQGGRGGHRGTESTVHVAAFALLIDYSFWAMFGQLGVQSCIRRAG